MILFSGLIFIKFEKEDKFGQKGMHLVEKQPEGINAIKFQTQRKLLKNGVEMESNLGQDSASSKGGLSIGNFSLFKRQFHRDLLDDR